MWREICLALSLLVAAALIVIGVGLWSVPAAFIVAGVAAAALGVLVFTEVG